jgi:hypothetical protein
VQSTIYQEFYHSIVYLVNEGSHIKSSIDSDFCQLSSSGDVVSKEHWRHYHKVTELFHNVWAFYLFMLLKSKCQQFGKSQ